MSAVAVVWSLGLIGALGLTLIAVKLLSELLRTLGHLRELTEWIADASGGLAEAMSGPLRLQEAAEAAEGLRAGAVALGSASTRLRDALRVRRHADSSGARRGPDAGGSMGAGRGRGEPDLPIHGSGGDT